MCDDGDRVTKQDGAKYSRPPTDVLARGAISLVWLYEGLWCKLLSGCPSHAVIVRSLPDPFSRVAGPLIVGIGSFEVALGLRVFSGRQRLLAAWVQTILLIVMNGGGLVWGRAAIPDPAGVVIQNVVLLVLAWSIADDRR